MMRIPLQATPNQTLAVTVARQPVQIALRQNGDSIFFDLLVNGRYIVRSRVCRDRQRMLVGLEYRGFKGNFAFVDTQGNSDPAYTGLGSSNSSRFQLMYLAVGE